LEKNQSRLTDLALNITPPEILQHPPFFTGQHLKITTCNKKNYRKKKTPTTSTGSSTGRNKTPTTKRLGDKPSPKRPGGNTSSRRGRHGASPPLRTELTEFSLFLEISDLLSLERESPFIIRLILTCNK